MSEKISLPIHQRFIQLQLFVWKTSIWQTIEGEKSHAIPSLSLFLCLQWTTVGRYPKLNYEISNRTRNQKKVYGCFFPARSTECNTPFELVNYIHEMRPKLNTQEFKLCDSMCAHQPNANCHKCALGAITLHHYILHILLRPKFG